MPLINVKLIEGVFSESQKRTIVEKITDAMVSIEGENLRPLTLVVIDEVKGGNWAVGGKPIAAADVRHWRPANPRRVGPGGTAAVAYPPSLCLW